MATPRSKGRLFELALLFLKLGSIGFGGPAAHIALMRDEVVARKKWVSEQRFLDLVGATNLIPGPNSTELAAHIGRERAGWRGLVVAGSSFIAPAMMIVLTLAWLYQRYSTSTVADAILYGVSPVVIAIIVFAVWGLAKTASKSPILLALGLAAFVLYLLGVNELLLLGGAAAFSSVLGRSWRPRNIGVFVTAVPASVIAAGSNPVELGRLFMLFLKFGSVVFGSGYVLFAFLRADLVVRLGWITSEQLIDAIAIGQVTPGPVFTAATFIGYLVAGAPGALLATLGIFLPSFVFVALLNPLVTKIRESTLLASMLDGLNVGALGLMAGVTVQLGRQSLVDPITISIAVISAGIIFLWRPNNVWLIVAGAAVGILRSFL